MSASVENPWPPPELADRLGFLLKHVQGLLAEATDAALAPHGLGAGELAVLVVLAETGPQHQQQIADRLRVDRTSMVTLVDRLEALGHAERRPDPSDRRRYSVCLTPAGRKAMRAAGRARDAAERQVLAPLSDQEARRLIRTLGRLLEQ